MTVYVDDSFIPAKVGRYSSRWCHLMADTTEELVTFAKRLGLKPSYIQHPGKPVEHFDVTESKRAQALRMGAVEIGWRDTVPLIKAKRRAMQLNELI